MKKLFLFLILVFSSVFGLYANASLESDPYGNGFTFPEYSDNLFIERTMDVDCDGCYANCGTTSCAGSGCCTCSCSTFNCECKPNTDPDPYGYTEPQIDISIDKWQYENLKKIAFLLYEAQDENAYQAYLHLSDAIITLKEKDAIGFHRAKDLYFISLAKITNDDAKVN